LVGLVIGYSLMVVVGTRWLRGAVIPASIGWVASGLAVAAIVTGLQAVLGLVAGVMLGNVWAVHAAAANRLRRG
jgi:hypothetical protein